MKKQKYTAEQRRQIKKQIVMGTDPAWSASVPQYTGNDTPEVVVKKIKQAYEAFMAVAIDFQQSDRSLLLAFLENNCCDMTNPNVWFSAWQRICDRLGVQSEPEPEHAPAPVAASPVAPEPRNKFKPGSWDWEKRERQLMEEDAAAELTPLLADAVKDITLDSGRHLNEQERKQLFLRFAHTRMPLTEATMRRLAIQSWGSRVNMTAFEDQGFRMDQCSSEELIQNFNVGNPHFGKASW